MTVEGAMHAYTCGAADALRAPALGRIAPGAHADLCIFAEDPFAFDWTRGTPGIAATIAAGQVVHGAIAVHAGAGGAAGAAGATGAAGAIGATAAAARH